MTKKIFLFLLLCMTWSFATWSYFPLQGSGVDAKASYVLGTGDGPQQIMLNGRWHNETFEVSVQNWGFQLSDDAGLTYPTFGFKIQAMPKTAFFVDITLPFGSRDEYSGFHVGIQQAFILTKHLAWAAEIGYTNLISNYNKDPASPLNISTEVDFNFKPSLIFFVGTEFDMNLSESESDEDGNTNGFGDAADVIEKLFFGASWKLSKKMSIEEEINMSLFGSGSYEEIDYLNFITSIKFSF